MIDNCYRGEQTHRFCTDHTAGGWHCDNGGWLSGLDPKGGKWPWPADVRMQDRHQ